jgi:HD-like signal output (HDOD) protein
MPISDDDIIQAARSLGVIGANRHVAHRILATLCDASLDARQIAEVIQGDPGIAARVLKVANSAYYGTPRQALIAALPGMAGRPPSTHAR